MHAASYILNYMYGLLTPPSTTAVFTSRYHILYETLSLFSISALHTNTAYYKYSYRTARATTTTRPPASRPPLRAPWRLAMARAPPCAACAATAAWRTSCSGAGAAAPACSTGTAATCTRGEAGDARVGREGVLAAARGARPPGEEEEAPGRGEYARGGGGW
jgi:hypothetical protein